MAKKSKQAYKQAPWRRQIQSIGLSLLPVVAIAIFIMLYLVISAQAAAAGLEIMNLHFDEEEILRKIANQRTQLALITSFTQMQKRAEKLGYEPASESNIQYIKISGYQGKNAVLIAPPPGIENESALLVNDLYNESLANWFVETFFITSQSSQGDGS
ncbi:MAG: hypothetical protein Q7J07_03155 [Pelolinea sp.]|nr:hypothetical protein [Pelolinea sp.]